MVICSRCKQQITSRNDLVVTTFDWLPLFRTYHNHCYAIVEKNSLLRGLFFYQPINSKAYRAFTDLGGLISAFLYTVLGIAAVAYLAGLSLFLFGIAVVLTLFIFIIFSVTFLYRFYSYHTFEKHLPEGENPSPNDLQFKTNINSHSQNSIDSSIICDICKNAITNRHDLVVTAYLIFFRTYHNTCYAGMEKRTLFRGLLFDQPINSRAYTGRIIYGLGMAILVYFFIGFISPLEMGSAFSIYLFLVLIFGSLFALGLRFYSYYKFEKPLLQMS